MHKIVHTYITYAIELNKTVEHFDRWKESGIVIESLFTWAKFENSIEALKLWTKQKQNLLNVQQ